MNRKILLLLLGSFILITLTTSQTVTPASAQSGGGYDLTWNVIAGGGTTSSTGGPYSLNGTIGQADAGIMNGESYSLIGGFWVDFLGNHIMLPLIEK